MNSPKNLLLALLLFASATAFGQSRDFKNQIAVGFGQGAYNGDLGNSWFKPREEFYGFLSLNYSRYAGKSFDAMLTVTSGDYGHCRDNMDPLYWSDGRPVINMLSRLTSGVLALRYKFANGYLLKEDARFAPYVYAGVGFNNARNIWRSTRVNVGNYASINVGAGLRYNFMKRYNVGYNLVFNELLSDEIDFRTDGGNDLQLQQTLSVGISF